MWSKDTSIFAFTYRFLEKVISRKIAITEVKLNLEKPVNKKKVQLNFLTETKKKRKKKKNRTESMGEVMNRTCRITFLDVSSSKEGVVIFVRKRWRETASVCLSGLRCLPEEREKERERLLRVLDTLSMRSRLEPRNFFMNKIKNKLSNPLIFS